MTDRPGDQPPDQPPPWPGQQPQQPPAWGQPAGWQQPQQPSQQPPAWPGQQQWGPPAPAGPYGQPGYGPYGPYGPVVPQTAGRATTVLVLGIVSLVMMFTCGLGFVTAIIALVMAPGAKREIAESGGRLTGESQVRTGSILSWVTLGLTALAVIVFAVVLGFAISVSDSSSGVEPPVVSPG